MNESSEVPEPLRIPTIPTVPSFMLISPTAKRYEKPTKKSKKCSQTPIKTAKKSTDPTFLFHPEASRKTVNDDDKISAQIESNGLTKFVGARLEKGVASLITILWKNKTQKDVMPSPCKGCDETQANVVLIDGRKKFGMLKKTTKDLMPQKISAYHLDLTMTSKWPNCSETVTERSLDAMRRKNISFYGLGPESMDLKIPETVSSEQNSTKLTEIHSSDFSSNETDLDRHVISGKRTIHVCPSLTDSY